MMNIHDVDVLLVEDNLNDAELVMEELKGNNLVNNLIHLTDGAQALEFIFGKGRFSERKVTDKPKVILLDIKMPKVDGLQVLQEIRKDERTRHIPVVIMTSSNEQKDIIESYNLGVNAYVVKPVGFDNFSKVVSEIGMFWVITNKRPN